jgi:uncharacterized surface protein with fasciclin (FAS1) repeats
MRTSYKTAMCAVILGAGAWVHGTQAITYTAETSPQIVRVASVSEDTDGIRTWTRIVALGGFEDLDKPARTLFVPSDAAFETLPKEEVAALLTPSQRSLRRAFLARAATDVLIAPEDVSGRVISVTTLDGRLLTIDATNGELTIGDAEALDVRVRSDGSVVYVLDRPLALAPSPDRDFGASWR